MKWEFSAQDKFLQYQEYIDTALVPLVQLELGADFSRSLSLATWLTGICHALEEQLTGRVMLFPAHTYVASKAKESVVEDIRLSSNYFREHGFKHVVYAYVIEEEDKLTEEMDDETYCMLAVSFPEQSEEGKWEIDKQLMEREARKLAPQIINLWQK